MLVHVLANGYWPQFIAQNRSFKSFGPQAPLTSSHDKAWKLILNFARSSSVVLCYCFLLHACMIYVRCVLSYLSKLNGHLTRCKIFTSVVTWKLEFMNRNSHSSLSTVIIILQSSQKFPGFENYLCVPWLFWWLYLDFIGVLLH